MPSSSNRIVMPDLDEHIMLVLAGNKRHFDEWKRTNIIPVTDAFGLQACQGQKYQSVHVLNSALKMWASRYEIEQANALDGSILKR